MEGGKMKTYKFMYQTVLGYWRDEKRKSITIQARNAINAEKIASLEFDTHNIAIVDMEIIKK